MRNTHKLIALLLAILAINSYAQTDITAHFTDPNFKAAVYNKIGKTDPAPILESDVSSITSLNVSSKNIASLAGIEYFTALKELVVYRNRLTTLDISKNTALTRLTASSNILTTLDISNNTALTFLDVYTNQLATLDVSKNTALTSLVVYDNQLATLDISNNTALTFLDASYNQLTTLDLSKNTALENLSVAGNQLTTLDVSNNTALTFLAANWSQLTTLDLSKNTALTYLNVTFNQLTSLDISGLSALEYLAVNDNYMADESAVTGFPVESWDGTNYIFWNQNPTKPTNLTATYTPTLTLANIELPTGWEWQDPLTTPLGNAGTKTHPATYTPTDPDKYNPAENIPLTITVAKAQIAPPTATTTSHTYNGSEKTAGITPNPAAYTVTGDKGTNANSYTATVTLDPNHEWTDGTDNALSFPWSIAKANPTATTLTGLTATVGQTLAEVSLAAHSGWSWMNPAELVGEAGERTHKAKFTPTDVANYNILENIDVKVAVSAPTPIFTNRENPIIGRIRVQTISNYILLSNLPKNTKVELYNLQGKRIYSAHPENPQILRIGVQTKGMYIVKIGSQTLRVAVK